MLGVAEPRLTEHRVIILETFQYIISRGMAEQARLGIVQREGYGAREGIEVLFGGSSYQNTVNPYSCACEE